MMNTMKNVFMFTDKKVRGNIVILLITIILYSFISIAPVYYIQKLIDTINIQNQEKAIYDILLFGSLYLFLQISAQLFGALSDLITEKIQTRFGSELQVKLYDHFQNSDMIGKENSTILSNRLIDDTKYVSMNFFNSIKVLFSSILTFIIGVGFMIQINIYLTLIIFPLGLITALTSRVIEKKAKIYADEKRNAEEGLWKCFSQGILGAFTLKLYDQKQIYVSNIRTSTNEVKKISFKQNRMESISKFAVGSLYMITIGFIMIFSAIFVIQNRISIGGLTALMMYNHMLVDPLINLLDCRQMLAKCSVSIRRIHEILHQKTSYRNISKQWIDTIECKDVSFWYDEDNKIFHHMDLVLQTNNLYLMKGRSGIGKTTFVNLIVGFLYPQSGTIRYLSDASYIDALPNVAYLMQDGFIFDISIKDNIKIANADISEKEMDRLIDVCCLKDVLDNFNDTPIGENGNLLSGGERKRLLLAQTLARKESHVLIFDELSSSLDSYTYKMICKNIQPFLKNKICIFIEHSEDHYMDYDAELKFQDGAIQKCPMII